MLLSKLFLLIVGQGVVASQLNDPVCIIGAGPAGIKAAVELELKGYRTVVFEKQNAVGGKCQAVYEKYFLLDAKVTTVANMSV